MCQNKLTRIVIFLQRTAYNIHAGEIDSLPRVQDSIASEQLSPDASRNPLFRAETGLKKCPADPNTIRHIILN